MEHGREWIFIDTGPLYFHTRTIFKRILEDHFSDLSKGDFGAKISKVKLWRILGYPLSWESISYPKDLKSKFYMKDNLNHDKKLSKNYRDYMEEGWTHA